MERDSGLLVEFARLQIGALDRAIAGEQILRQRRPLVGRMSLAADQHHLAAETGAAQRLGGAAAGMAGAENDDEAIGIGRHKRALSLRQ